MVYKSDAARAGAQPLIEPHTQPVERQTRIGHTKAVQVLKIDAEVQGLRDVRRESRERHDSARIPPGERARLVICLLFS